MYEQLITSLQIIETQKKKKERAEYIYLLLILFISRPFLTDNKNQSEKKNCT